VKHSLPATAMDSRGMGTARASRTVGEGQIYHDVVCFLAGLVRDNRRGDQMWLIAAILSSFFAGITSVLAKCGIKKIDSDIATALRTIVVLLCSGFGSCRRLYRHNHADPAKVIAVFNFIRRGCGCVLAFIV